MLNILAKLSLFSLDRIFLDYIKTNPGSRLFQIDNDTLQSHHNWGAKHIVERLEEQGRITVIRHKWGKKIAPRYFALV